MTKSQPQTLELPNGESVTPDDVFLYSGYPYRFVPLDHAKYDFKLTPLYWGNSDMDVPFPDHSALADQWGPESEGTLTDDEWQEWIADAREDHRFGDDEVDALARELTLADTADGLLSRIKHAVGL